MMIPPGGPPAPTAAPRLFALGDGAAIILLDMPSRTAARLELNGGGRLVPLVSLRLPLVGGGHRTLWGLRAGGTAEQLNVYGGLLAAPQPVTIGKAVSTPRLDVTALFAGLTQKSKLNLLSTLLGVWSGVLKLRRSTAFVELMRGVTTAFGPHQRTAKLVARFDERHAIASTEIDHTLGRIRALYRLGRDRAEPISFRPYLAPSSRTAWRVLVAGEFLKDDLVVMVCENGVGLRTVSLDGSLLLAPKWWKSDSSDIGVRGWIAELMAEPPLGSTSAALEFQLGTPLRAHAVAGKGGMPSAQINVAIGARGGLLVGGWFQDPHNLVSGLELLDGPKAPNAIEDRWHLFPSTSPNGPVKGFAAWIGNSGRADTLLQPRFGLRLRSGERRLLIPAPQAPDIGERRATVLSSIPPEYLSDTVIGQTLAPALAALQSDFLKSIGEAEVEEIGRPIAYPKISIVVPLYKVLDFLRAQVAAFAADPETAASADIIYVLDSPEDAEDTRQLLRGLNLLYDIPLRLVVMPRNSGYARACNTGARLAHGDILAMLNSDVIPPNQGWLDPLLANFEASADIAAAGPKLLFEDDSIQHAGLYFDRDHQGRWLNHHFFKGFPRDFPTANIERFVPAVTGACLLVRRDAFEAVRGFTEDYVIGDYEDSDLCLKLRREGGQIRYVPRSELYHFERQSIRKSADYMRGVAARYNSWLHAERWTSEMEELHAHYVMQAEEVGARKLLPATTHRIRRAA